MDSEADVSKDEPFPWHLGLNDAHCHPTDTMSTIDSITEMKTRRLTIFSTRAADQELVAQVADKLGFKSEERIILDDDSNERVVPGFGWHPWFSHQLYDDISGDFEMFNDSDQRSLKERHYQKVLYPEPVEADFLDSLPEPRPLSEQISQTKALLEKYPLALIGEIGLDRSFRLPEAWTTAEDCVRDPTLTPGGREGRRLTRYRVTVDHQKRVLLSQLHLAGEMRRAVSVHGVQAHGVLHETFQEVWEGYRIEVPSRKLRKRQGSIAEAHADEGEKPNDAIKNGHEKGEETSESKTAKPFPPRVCLHSYSGPAQGIKIYTAPAIPSEVFFSFSSVINLSKTAIEKVHDVIKSVPDDRILVESDLHCAGSRMDSYLEEITRLVCQTKGWSLNDGVEQLGKNWRRFIFGHDR